MRVITDDEIEFSKEEWEACGKVFFILGVYLAFVMEKVS